MVQITLADGSKRDFDGPVTVAEVAQSISPGLAKVYRNQLEHDPLDIHRAREIASSTDVVPVGILYQNRDVPCYEDTRQLNLLRTNETIRQGLEYEFDKYTV